MCVEPAPSDLVATRVGVEYRTESSEQWRYEHDRTAQFVALFHEILALQEVGVDMLCLETVAMFAQAMNSYTHVGEQVDKVVHVENIGYVVDDDFVGS